MGTALLISHGAEAVTGPLAAARLAALGVTRVSLLQDEGATAVVLEGWAFDPAYASRATEIVFPAGGEVRVMRQLEDIAISPEAGLKGGNRR